MTVMQKIKGTVGNNFFHNQYSLIIVTILAEVEKSETFMFKKVCSTFLLKW